MTSTTLITFLLRAPSNVRSVDLLGSWDNFSRPYPMERDRRMGAGHWRGCHTFTDIVRDGTSPSESPGRTGGLKMGGTYWYYYRLDGEVEFYNEVEPLTSLCPLLPGQPVNILNVPIILPDTDYLHRRDNSISSVKSDQRTMDPKDKYMNPRTPPKPRPGLPRLKTSPPFYQQSAPSSLFHLSNSNDDRSPMSQPASSTHSPMFFLAPKVKVARSVSPPRSRGLRAAFLNIAGARSPGGDHSDDHVSNTNNKPHDIHHAVGIERSVSPMASSQSLTSHPSSNHSSRMTSPMSSPVELDGVEIGRLPFRNPQAEREQTPEPPSIRVRRASKSSRDKIPLLSELSLRGAPSSHESNKAGLSACSRPTRLETLEEALSQQTTPMAVHVQELSATPSPISSTPMFLNPREKRLPTLPNSPSSVLDAELRAIDAQYRPLDMEMLRSHFSDDTSGIASALYESQSPQEKSRFSEWSTDTELISPASMTSSSSTFNLDQLSNCSPVLIQSAATEDAENAVNNDRALAALNLPSISVSGPTTPVLGSEAEIILSPAELAADSPLLHSPSRISVSSPTKDIEFSSINIEDFDYDDSFHESDPKRQGAILPLFRVVTPLSVSSGDDASRLLSSPRDEHSRMKRASDDYTMQSAAMKELMDEIGYLGDMISSGL